MNFRRVFKDLVSNYNPDIVIIMEPKMPSARCIRFFNKLLHCDNMIVEEDIGRAGQVVFGLLPHIIKSKLLNYGGTIS